MKLAAIFKDNMILERDKTVRVFGWTDSVDTLTVSIDGIKVVEEIAPRGAENSDAANSNAEVETNKDRGCIYDWVIELPPHEAGGPYEMTIDSMITGETITISDILFGEVWLNAGQSNIEFMLKEARGGMDEIRKSDYPEIRYYTVPDYAMVDEGLEALETETSWKSLTGRSYGEVSAIGYYYSVMLYEKLGVPIGMIDCYKGGTSISCWMERDTLESMPEGRIYLEEYDGIIDSQTDEEYDAILADYDERNAEHDRIVEVLKAANPNVSPQEIYEKAGRYSWPPPLGRTSPFRPCGLVESKLKRIVPYTITGVVYYQGEEDALRNMRNIDTENPEKNTMYRNLLVRFIGEIRKFFRDDKLPFIDIGLTQFIEWGMDDPRDWAYLREAQEMAICQSGLNDVYLASLIDLGEFDNVHPVDKKTPGERVGHIILGIYGKEDMPKYPEAIDFAYFENRVEIKVSNVYFCLGLLGNELIDHRGEISKIGSSVDTAVDTSVDMAASGAIASSASLIDSNHVYGFEIYTEEGICDTPQKVTIQKDKIVIEDDRGITGVSYGFFNYGKVNVYNTKGLPLKQFRHRK